jgi:hypothetical protein
MPTSRPARQASRNCIIDAASSIVQKAFGALE